MVQLPLEQSADGRPNNGLFQGDADIYDDFSENLTTYLGGPGLSSTNYTYRTANTGQRWTMNFWVDYVFPEGGGPGTPLPKGVLTAGNGRMHLGPWTNAMISCSPIGQLDTQIESWSGGFYRPMILVVGDAGPSFGDQGFLYMRPDGILVPADSFDIYELPATDAAEGGVATIDPAIQPGDQVTLFFYRDQRIHVYVNGTLRKETAVEAEGDTEVTGVDFSVRRWRGFRTFDGSVNVNYFRWTAAASDAALVTRETLFNRPKPLTAGGR